MSGSGSMFTFSPHGAAIQPPGPVQPVLAAPPASGAPAWPPVGGLYSRRKSRSRKGRSRKSRSRKSRRSRRSRR